MWGFSGSESRNSEIPVPAECLELEVAELVAR